MYIYSFTTFYNIIIIIIRSRRQQRSVASTQSGHDDEPWTIQHECWRVYRHQSAGSMNGAGVLAVAANQDQNGSRFLLMRPVIMRGELACGHRVSPHGRTNAVMIMWYRSVYNEIASDVYKLTINRVYKLRTDNLQLVLINVLIRSIFEHHGYTRYTDVCEVWWDL